MKYSKGFSLLEVLVSMALLSMIVLIGSSAFGMFAQRWDGQLGKFDSTLTRTRNLILVQEVLDSLLPYVVYDSDDKPVIFFEGNRNGFIAVASNSVFGGEQYATIRFSVIQNVDLTFDVTYEESLMRYDLLRTAQQKLIFSSPLVLFDSITKPQFEYYGWASIEAKNGVDGVRSPESPTWLEDFNALDLKFAPLKARLKFASGLGSFEILSNLAKEPKGLLSRYSGGRQRRRNEIGEEVNPDAGCSC